MGHLELVPLRQHCPQGSPLQRVRCASRLLGWDGEASTPFYLTLVKQATVQSGCLQLSNMVCVFLLLLDLMCKQPATEKET